MSSQGQRGQRSGSPSPPQVLKWTPSMDEAYEAAVEKLGGLDQCKPKAVLQQLQADHPDLFADMDIQRVKWKLLSHRRREMRHRAMAPQGIAPPTKWSGRLEEAYEAAVAQLGGIHSAQPKQLLEQLQPEFPDLTLEVIKWHLQGQRRRERRITGRSGSTQHSSQQQQQEQQEEQQEDAEEQEAQEEQEEQGRGRAQRPKQQRQQPARRRRRAASPTSEADGASMSAAGASDDEQEAANAQQQQQQLALQPQQQQTTAQHQHQQQTTTQQQEQPLPPSWLQQPSAAQWTVEQQLVQQGIAQQLGQVAPAVHPLLQLPHLPPLPAAARLPDALLAGPPAPGGLVAGGSAAAGVVGVAGSAQHTLPAAFQALAKVRRSRLIASQLVALLEEQRAKLVRLVPTLVAAEAAQPLSSNASGASGDPLSQLLQTAQLLPAGQPWPALAGASSMLPPAAARDISPVPHKRQLHGVLAAAAALPLCSASAAVGPLQSSGGGSRSSGESGEEHLLTCTIPNCRRCAYERRLQASKQQQGAATQGQQQEQAQQQQQAQQAQQQQQAVELAASIGSEPLLDFKDPALIRLLGSMLGSMPSE